MPRVTRTPRYSEPQVQSSPMPGVRVPTQAPLEAFGGGVSARPFEAVGDLAGTAQKESLRQMAEARELADYTKLLEIRRAFNEWEAVNLDDPRKGALATRGKDALGIEKPLKESFRKFAAQQEQDLHGAEQKLRFRQSVLAREEQVLGRVRGHIGQQIKVLQVDEYEATAESSKERAMRDPATAPAELAVLLDATLERGKTLGLGRAATDQEMQKQESDFHRRVIEAMLSRDEDGGAKAYYDKNKLADVLDPDADVDIRKALKRGTDRSEARREADIILGYVPKPTPGGDSVFNRRPAEPDAYEQARKIKNDDVRAMVEQIIEHDFARQKRLDEEQYKGRMEEAADVIEKTKSVAAIPPTTWTRLKFRDQQALTRYAKQAASGVEPETNWEEWTRLRLLKPAELAKFTKSDLLLVARPVMNDKHYEEFAKRVEDARRGGEKYQSQFSDDQLRLKYLGDAGLAGITKVDTLEKVSESKEKAAMYGRFKEAVETRLAAYHENTGQNADDKEKKKIMGEIATQWSQKVTVIKARRASMAGRGYASSGADITEQKTLAELTAPEAKELVRQSEFVIPTRLRTEFFHVARSKPGLLPQGMTQQRFESEHRGRVNRAYLAALAGADDQRIEAILSGRD